MKANKSLRVAYVLWFFLGWLGVHQFYLKRDRHAFFLWATVGGVFGLGWLRDFFYLPTYVDDVNESDEYMAELEKRMKNEVAPKQSFCRFAAGICLGILFGELTIMSFWKADWHGTFPYQNIVVSLAAWITATVGNWIVFNEGRQRVSFLSCLGGIQLPTFAGQKFGFNTAAIYIASYWYSSAKVEWREKAYTDGSCKRITRLGVLGLLYLGLILIVVSRHLATQDFLNDTDRFYLETKYDNAYQMLGLNPGVSEKEIKSAYREFALKYHPDKEQDPARKQEMAEKFIKIQAAYETLSKPIIQRH